MTSSDFARSRRTLSWSWRRDLNPQPPHYKCGALPLSYASSNTKTLKKLTGIEGLRYATAAGNVKAENTIRRRDVNHPARVWITFSWRRIRRGGFRQAGPPTGAGRWTPSGCPGSRNPPRRSACEARRIAGSSFLASPCSDRREAPGRRPGCRRPPAALRL